MMRDGAALINPFLSAGPDLENVILERKYAVYSSSNP